MVIPRAALAIAASVLALAWPSAADAQLFTLSRDQLIELSAQNPFDRFPDGRPRVPDDLIERARGLSAEEIWAVLPRKGFRNQYADGSARRTEREGAMEGEGRARAAGRRPSACRERVGD